MVLWCLEDSLPAPQVGVVMDLDGTLWHGNSAIEGAAEFWDYLTAHDVPSILLTNSGEKRPADVVKKFADVFGRSLSSGIVWSAMANLASFLHDEVKLGRLDEILVVSKATAWREYPFSSHARAFDPSASHDGSVRRCIALFSDGSIDAYADTVTAMAVLVREDCIPLYASSDDDTVTRVARHRGVELAVMAPGPGLILEAVRTLLPKDRHALIRSFGKGTDVAMAEKAILLLRERCGFTGKDSDVHFIGDRLNADIRAALQIGGVGVHVESGCHTERHYPRFPMDRPHVVASTLTDLGSLFDCSVYERLRNTVHNSLCTVSHRIRRGDLGSTLRTTLHHIERVVMVPPRRAVSVPARLDKLGAS